MYAILRQITKTGVKTAAAPAARQAARIMEQRLHRKILRHFGKSLAIRHVDTGSYNGCKPKTRAIHNPYYNPERLGAHFAANPHRTDLLLAAEPAPRQMKTTIERTFDAPPDPGWIVAAGNCACYGCAFGKSYASCRQAANAIPVDTRPPTPTALVATILAAALAAGK